MLNKVIGLLESKTDVRFGQWSNVEVWYVIKLLTVINY